MMAGRMTRALIEQVKPMSREFSLECPVPIDRYPRVLLAHGGGGRLMHQLLEEMILPAFAAPGAEEGHDGAVLELAGGRVAFTTDSFVVRPLFFPGGDIGRLAINGTVNDLAVCGARPLFLSAGLILEEGLAMETLWRVVRSMAAAAREAGVDLVTGDTKVVERGKGDGVFVNTAGLGLVPDGVRIGPARVRPGDAVLLSGDLGRHAVAILSVREGLEFESEITSDTAPLHGLVQAMLETGADVHCLRDLTRGGLASALNEIARSAGAGIELEEAAIPVGDEVRGACELLGLDPLHAANEGRLAAFVPWEAREKVLAAMRAHPMGRGAALVGRVVEEGPREVRVRSPIGGVRVLDVLSGEQLPRIC